MKGRWPALARGRWHKWTVDATRSNAWNDLRTAELTATGSGDVAGGRFVHERILEANSVTPLVLSDGPER